MVVDLEYHPYLRISILTNMFQLFKIFVNTNSHYLLVISEITSQWTS
jgi:hypothetical protein